MIQLSDVHPRQVLVLMACSGTKNPYLPPGAYEAHDVYFGPLWQTLCTHIGKIPWHHVCVLSAKYGFIKATHKIHTYDAHMTKEKADYLIDRGVLAHNDRYGEIRKGMPGCHALIEAKGSVPYRAVLLVASGHYLRVFQDFCGRFFEVDWLFTPDSIVREVKGGIGQQRQQLGQWLREINRR